MLLFFVICDSKWNICAKPVSVTFLNIILVYFSLLCDISTGTLTNRGSSFEDFSLSGADPSEFLISTVPNQNYNGFCKHCNKVIPRVQVYTWNHWTDDDDKLSEASLTCEGLLSFDRHGSSGRLSPRVQVLTIFTGHMVWGYPLLLFLYCHIFCLTYSISLFSLLLILIVTIKYHWVWILIIF